jgi:hypothetical protein
MDRPAWCLEQAQAFLQALSYMREFRSDWSHLPSSEQLMANLLWDAHLRGQREGDWSKEEQSSPWPPHDVVRKLVEAADHLLNDHNCDAHGYEGVMQARDRARKWLSEGLLERAEQEIELDATLSELEAMKGPFTRLMKILRLVDMGDPESPVICVQGKLSMSLWHQLRNVYEATLPPVDHSWLDRLEEEEDP